AVELMKKAVRSTYNSRVIAGIGAFGGQYDASVIRDCKAPVLVASTDGVGTKTSLALKLDRMSHSTQDGLSELKAKGNSEPKEKKSSWLAGLGTDMVNHSINDILVQGARPLFFMDYIAAEKIDPAKVAEIVEGMSEACREAHCVLLGGETAEMPGTYREGEMDIAGTIVGIVERDRLLPRSDITQGDVLVGLASTGLHTNGYSLARSITASMNLEEIQPELGESLAAALLRPHRSYFSLLGTILEVNPNPIKALAHITGGGLFENIPRVLPHYLDAQISVKSWQWPAIFSLLQRWGNVSDEEMRRVFNLGIGMVAILEESQLDSFLAMLPEAAYVIGKLVEGTGKVVFA
ncbi:MAG TPA: phosphoribosylformylglycinamidine cyclo-ligase, partial [Rectinema sp.]|nr:phosphoribosylformylglycinamidine cyclo-ligase [Rectinema sp.]